MHSPAAHESRSQKLCAADLPARTRCPGAGPGCAERPARRPFRFGPGLGGQQPPTSAPGAFRGRLLQLALCATLTASAAEGGGTGPQSLYHSPNHVCLSVDELRAYVTNQTSNSVSVLDLVARKVVAEIPVGPFPAHAAPSPDGKRLYVSCNFGAKVDVIELAKGRVVRSVPVGDEPYGMAVSPDGQTLFVANSLSSTLSIIDLKSGQPKQTVPVGREPRFIAQIPGGSRLLVGNGLSRSVAVIDAATGQVLELRNLDRGNLARQVACTNDGRWGLVAHVISQDKFPPLQMERGMVHSNGFSMMDLEKPGHRVTLLLDRLLLGAANPWGLAVSADDRQLFVSLAGVHEIAIIDLSKVVSLVTQLRPEEIDPLAQNLEIMQRRGMMRRVPSGGIGPRGIALNRVRGELLVANYFSDSVSILDSQSGKRRAVIPLGPLQEMTPWRHGEMLFNDARLCFQQWFSCASCHQEDATMDGLNWDLSNDNLGNPKNVKSLHYVHDTPPAMWGGVRKEMNAAVAAGQRFLGLLPQPDNHHALMTYFGAPRLAPNPYRRRNPEKARRGESVFVRARCNACHPPPLFTDLRKHNLELAAETDLRSRFDTPTLRECYRTAPYLHDGRAATLLEIFTKHNPRNLHGLTGNLSDDELDELIAYLRTL